MKLSNISDLIQCIPLQQGKRILAENLPDIKNNLICKALSQIKILIENEIH